jgi:hypothetical protein
MSKLQEKPSALKREHQALQKLKCLWVIFALLDPDCENPDTDTDTDPGIQSGSGSAELVLK